MLGVELEDAPESELVVDEVEVEPLVDSFDSLDSLDSLGVLVAGPFAEADEPRESLIYQPLPLKTMPTGWMTLRSVPPHCSHVVSGGSEKL